MVAIAIKAMIWYFSEQDARRTSQAQNVGGVEDWTNPIFERCLARSEFYRPLFLDFTNCKDSPARIAQDRNETPSPRVRRKSLAAHQGTCKCSMRNNQSDWQNNRAFAQSPNPRGPKSSALSQDRNKMRQTVKSPGILLEILDTGKVVGRQPRYL